jgi:hypothetical protein
MAGVFEPASSGRAKCRGCGQAIARGELRCGELLPNPYGDGEMTLWFHPWCAAYKRPEPLLESLAPAGDAPVDRERLERAARHAAEHRRLPRIDGGERAPTGQARCRQCREPIARGAWRIRLVFYDEGRFEAGGFVHVSCAEPYFETGDVADAVLHFSGALSGVERAELRQVLEAKPTPQGA